MNTSHAGPKCTALINYALISAAVTIILSYSILTVDYSHAQKISPSNFSSTDDISNSSNNNNNNNNTSQMVKDEVGKNAQENQQSTALEQQQSQALPSVKITSHTQNQDIPIGTLAINGISSDTPSDMCTVYIILNNIKPYQKVIPVSKEDGQSSHNDFSTWNYTFTPQYATIKEGNNKMTSKISCDALAATGANSTNNNLTKFNSLNVTGGTTNSGNSSNGNSTQVIKPLSNITSADSPIPQSATSYNTSQNTIYSPLTPAPSTVNPLNNNIEDDKDEIQSSNEQDEEIDIDETNEDDDDTNNERSRAREVFDRVEESLRDNGINFDISSMLD
jgi:hypothetical protein